MRSPLEGYRIDGTAPLGVFKKTDLEKYECVTWNLILFNKIMQIKYGKTLMHKSLLVVLLRYSSGDSGN